MVLQLENQLKKLKKNVSQFESQLQKLQNLQKENDELKKSVSQLESQLKNLTSVLKNTSSQGTLTSSSILGSLESKYLDKLNSYLGPVLQSPGKSRFVRYWHAKTDGWAASTFHSNCDGKGPTVTIVQVGNDIFGGYVDKSWGGCEYHSSRKAFLFSLYNVNGYAPVKLNIKPSDTMTAIYSCADRGPDFGGNDLVYETTT